MPRRARSNAPEVTGAEIDEAERRVRAEAAVPVARLVDRKLDRRSQMTLFEALERRGLERTPRFVRLPLRDQLLELVVGEARVGLDALAGRIRGATRAEAKSAAIELARRGSASLALVDGKELVVSSSSDVLSDGELAMLESALKDLAKQLRTVRTRSRKGPPRRLLRAEVTDLLGRAVRAPSASGAAGAEERNEAPILVGARQALLDTIGSLESQTMKLVFVPDLVRTLAPAYDARAIHGALLAATAAGEIELRPESGLDTLSPGDAALCPRAPDGSPLSYIRRTHP